ncbi:Bifunctional phosphoglucose/phosphomannose isomerase [uncultured archaeon]|nr:Bifunctional phosphoglucose/phosphomannose isomerase [uncultured archaeon]
MHKIYDMWPEIAKKSYKSEQNEVDFTDIDHIVFAGMGGSGALGDIFSSILSKTKIHVAVTKGYHLPNTVDSNTLVIATSISGNTVETLSVLNSAKKSECKIVAFSSGGKMQGYCNKNKIEYRNIPQLHSPRASFTGFLYTILKVLGPVLPIKKYDILDSITELESLSKQISSDNLTEKNPSLRLAQWISGIPIIYYPFGLQAAAIRFKNSLQENSKIHAMAEDILEASHNGIVSWEKQSIVQPILLEGYNDYIKTKERWKILKEYFQENKIDYREIFSVKGNILSKLINLIYLLDYSTIYRAVLSEVDPSPIQSIDFIKSKLSSRLE